ncbi:hypothetical protein P23_0681 [Acinetobacter calcoaceticus]|jgi:hypothetical protein|nr:hypothetical protein P23_0681 [Acinetobacter calcoaceticus]
MFYWHIPCQEASKTTSMELLVLGDKKEYIQRLAQFRKIFLNRKYFDYK